jgi:signal peptidase I
VKLLARLVLWVAVSVGGLIGIAVVLAVVLAVTGVLHVYRVPSSSMEPTLHCARPAPLCRGRFQDRVIVLSYVFGGPKQGDIVAFHTPKLAALRCGSGGIFIKRVTRIVRGRYFLEGDNRAASCDSRIWGTVARSAIIGKVRATYWPPNRVTVR